MFPSAVVPKPWAADRRQASEHLLMVQRGKGVISQEKLNYNDITLQAIIGYFVVITLNSAPFVFAAFSPQYHLSHPQQQYTY